MNIDEDVPIPPITKPKKSKWAFMLDMKEGDSFLLSDKIYNYSAMRSARSTIYQFAQLHGFDIETRMTSSGVRVWRVNKG